jgi:hypothetical protein
MPPPPVANANANAMLNHAYYAGGPIPDVETRAFRAARRATVAMIAHHINEQIVTGREVGEQQAFAVKESSLAVVGDQIGLPAELSPALIAALATLSKSLNDLNTNMNQWFDDLEFNMNQQFDDVDSKLDNIEARQTNVVATEHDDPIRVITGPGGQNPPEGLFPNTYGQLLTMGPIPCKNLLLFYGLPANPSVNRNQRLRKFLGAN